MPHGTITYGWREPITNREIHVLHAAAFKTRLFDESEWDRDTVTGLGLFSIAGLISGVTSLSQKKPGERMAIAGVVLSSITLLVFIGLLVG